MADAAQEQATHGDMDEGFRHVEPRLVVPHQAALADHPAEGALNGLITNDKFCLTRTGRLRLSWPRARGGLRDDDDGRGVAETREPCADQS